MYETFGLEAITMGELISYSKLKESPTVTIIDNLTESEFNFLVTIAERLQLIIFLVKDSNMAAFIYHTKIAKKIGLNLQKRIQVMFCDFAKRPNGSITIYALTGYCKDWIILRDNGYIVEAYNEQGEEMQEWIKTDIEEIATPNLSEYDFKNYSVSLSISGIGNSGRSNSQIIELSRYHYMNDGTFNEKRQCYYPKDLKSNKNIADFNKLEKLFRNWGFQKTFI
jgi:hypothetical protein